MPFRVGVDQDLDAGKFPVKARFDLVHDPMSFPHGHLRADPDVKLRKVMHPAGPGAQIMDAAYPGMMSCRLNETLPPFQRPFLVHELIHGAAGRAKGVPRQPERNADSEQGVCAGKPKRSEEHTSELQSLMRISYDVFCLK